MPRSVGSRCGSKCKFWQIHFIISLSFKVKRIFKNFTVSSLNFQKLTFLIVKKISLINHCTFYPLPVYLIQCTDTTLLLLSHFSRVRLLRPQRWQPTRLPCPWNSPGKNTGVGCHFLLQCMKGKSESEVAQSCWLLATPWTTAYQAPPSMGFSRQEYWSGVPLPSPTDTIVTMK